MWTLGTPPRPRGRILAPPPTILHHLACQVQATVVWRRALGRCRPSLRTSMALTIISNRLPSGDTPVCGVPLDPYVLCRKDNNTTATADELPEEGASSARFSLRFRWYRSVVQRSGAVCWIHPEQEANLQCILCLRCKVDIRKSYHCSTSCLRQHWSYHKELHEQKKQNGKPSGIILLMDLLRISAPG